MIWLFALATLGGVNADDCQGLVDAPTRITFADAVQTVARRLPPDWAQEFLAMAEPVLRRPVQATSGPSRLSYRFRLFDPGVRRGDRASVLWNERPPADESAAVRLRAATIALVTEFHFTPVRRHSVYLRPKDTFVAQNVELLRKKLMFQMLAAGGSIVEAKTPGPVRRLVRRVLLPLLPTQFAVLRDLKLTTEHKNVFMYEGPGGLYRLLARREGREMATRYWLTHVTNAVAITAAAFVATLAPTLYESWRYMFDLHVVRVSDDQLAAARDVFESMRATPETILRRGREILDQVSPDERRALMELFRPTR